MASRTAVVIASFLIGLGAVARESFAQHYPPQAYPPPRDYPLAGYQPLPPVDADDDYDLPAGGRSHTGAAGPGQVDPPGPGLMRDDPRTLAALPPEVRPETGPKKELPPQFRRTLVDYYTKQPAGTIVIDTPNTYLYLVLGNGKALRYGIGVGREGFTWSGTEHISRKAEWPDWTPPEEMIVRQPYLPRFMAGGETNPPGGPRPFLGQE